MYGYTVLTTKSAIIQKLFYLALKAFCSPAKPPKPKPVRHARCSSLLCWRKAVYQFHLTWHKQPMLACSKCGDKTYLALKQHIVKTAFVSNQKPLE